MTWLLKHVNVTTASQVQNVTLNAQGAEAAITEHVTVALLDGGETTVKGLDVLV